MRRVARMGGVRRVSRVSRLGGVGGMRRAGLMLTSAVFSLVSPMALFTAYSSVGVVKIRGPSTSVCLV